MAPCGFRKARDAVSPRTERAVLASGLLLFVLLAGIGLVRDASVADEHPHILAGWLAWRTHHATGGFDNPPLGQLLVAAPLALFHIPYLYPDDGVLVWCRIPVLLAAATLGGLVWRWGRALGGAWVAAIAVAMFAFEPNLLAQSHVATLDALVTVAWWMALWMWRCVLLAPPAVMPWRALAGFAVWVAVAVLVKFTAVLLLPVAFAVALLVCRGPARVRRPVAGVVLGVVAIILLAHAVYGLGPVEMLLPRELVESLRGKFAHRGEVQFAYLAGRRSDHGFLLYYLVALGLKCPLPLLGFAVWGGRVARSWSRADQALVAIPAVAVVTAFTLLRVNIGIRHVLPALPALILLAAAGARDLWGRGRPARAAVLALGVLWMGGVVRIAPQYFPYFNELAGGPAGGHRWLLDSNLSWGQDDRRLQDFLTAAQARGEAWETNPDPDLPRTGRFVVEVNALHNLQRRSDRLYEWLRDLPAAGFAGWSWRRYQLDVATFAAAAARHPETPAAPAAYAEVLRAAGDSAQARVVLETAAARDPGGVAERVARSALRCGDWRAARAWLDRAARAGAGSIELQLLAEWCRLQTAAAVAPDERERSRAGTELGIWLAEHGKRDAALAVLLQAAGSPAAGAETWRALAIAHAQNAAYGAAREVLARANLQDVYAPEFELCSKLAAAATAIAAGVPVPPEIAFELGRGAFESGQYDAAAAAFAAVLRADPSHRLALAYLGEMQVRCKMRIVDQVLTPRAVLAGS